jgi:hypothetical protein
LFGSGDFEILFGHSSYLSLFAEDVWTADGPLAGEQADGWRLQAGPHHPQQEAEVGRGRSQPAGTEKRFFSKKCRETALPEKQSFISKNAAKLCYRINNVCFFKCRETAL